MKRMELIRPMKDEMLRKLARLVRHDSRQGEALEGKPFGENVRRVLDLALADAEKNVIFGGRLGEYKYYDMDKVIAAALDMAANEK